MTDNRQPSGWRKRALLFLTSQCITLFGSTLVQMALVWYAAMETASGGWVAAFSVCSYLPQFLVSFLGGVWADRYNRKALIIGADVLIACATLAMIPALPHIPSGPALLGGLTSSVFEDGKVYSVKRNVDETLCFAAIVPDYKLLTEAARAALPKEVSHRDAVYNLSRAALVPAAFCEGRHDLLAIATEDKLHQPYRMPLMPGSKEVFDMARLCGAKAVYVSGAGSTVMAVAEKADAEKFYSKLEKGLELLEGLDGCEAFTLLQLDADNTGATVE